MLSAGGAQQVQPFADNLTMRGRLRAAGDLWIRRIEELARLARERFDTGDVDGAIRALNRLYFRELTILTPLPIGGAGPRLITHPASEPLLQQAVSDVGGELDTPPDGDAVH